ncbi:hypothetical protein Tco_0285102, partial [Tanacetum coccineum]
SERVSRSPRDSLLPRVYTLGSDEGSMTLQELMVKRLEKNVKTSHSRKRAKIVILDDKEDSEDSSKQGRMIEEIDQDAGVTLVTPIQGEDQPEDQLGVLSAAKVLADAAKTNVHTYTRRRRAVSTGSGGISTAGASMPVSTTEQRELNYSQNKRVLVPEASSSFFKRMARVHEAAQSFTEEEWENIRARVNVQKGNISIKKVASEDNIADIFTKPLKCEVFNYLRLGLGMMELIMDSDSPSSQK